MQRIQELLTLHSTHTLSERSELVGYFTEKINQQREGTKYRPLTPRAIAIKLGHLNLTDIYYLKSICDDAQRRNGAFSKVFWSSLKVK